MHVHRVFPYIYVPYDGSSPADAYLRQFASSLDYALNFSVGAVRFDADQPSTSTGPSNWNSRPQQHVFKINIVKGMWVYRVRIWFAQKILLLRSQSINRSINQSISCWKSLPHVCTVMIGFFACFLQPLLRILRAWSALLKDLFLQPVKHKTVRWFWNKNSWSFWLVLFLCRRFNATVFI